jgi:hypothetical protein
VCFFGQQQQAAPVATPAATAAPAAAAAAPAAEPTTLTQGQTPERDARLRAKAAGGGLKDPSLLDHIGADEDLSDLSSGAKSGAGTGTDMTNSPY